MYTEKQIKTVFDMDRDGARIRTISATVGLSGKVVKRILLGQISVDSQEDEPALETVTPDEPKEVVVTFEPEPAIEEKEEEVAIEQTEPAPLPWRDGEEAVIPLPPDKEIPVRWPSEAVKVGATDTEEELILEALKDEKFLNLLSKKSVKKAECLLWEGAMQKGEPHISYKSHFLPLFRVVYYQRYGAFPLTEVSCRLHPRCINPKHMDS